MKEPVEELNKKNYNKTYYQINREKMTAKHICVDCGGKYSLNSKTHHLASKKHNNAIQLKKKDEEIEKLKLENVKLLLTTVS